jgi:hypothetical protein
MIKIKRSFLAVSFIAILVFMVEKSTVLASNLSESCGNSYANSYANSLGPALT